MLAVINFFGMWFVIEERKLSNCLLEGGEGEIRRAAFEYVQPRYLLLHPLMSFASRQFSLDFVQLQFKAYAGKLAFLGRETCSAKIASLQVALACKGRPSLALCCTLGVYPMRRTRATRGSCAHSPYTGTVLWALQSRPDRLLPAADAKLVCMF